MRSLANPHLRLVHRSAADQLRRIFADVYEVVSSSPECISDSVRMASMARDLRSAVVATLTYGHSNGMEVLPSRRALIVRDTRQLVMEWPDRYARVEELCRALGISRRTLQISFQEALGIKPSAYLVAVRLNGARRSIRYVRSVAEAATSWGFWHLGASRNTTNPCSGTTFGNISPAPRSKRDVTSPPSSVSNFFLGLNCRNLRTTNGRLTVGRFSQK